MACVVVRPDIDASAMKEAASSADRPMAANVPALVARASDS